MCLRRTGNALVGPSLLKQDDILDTEGATASQIEASARAKRPKREPPAPEVAAERPMKKAVAVVAGLADLADLSESVRVSRVKRLEPLMEQILALRSAVTRQTEVEALVDELPPKPDSRADPAPAEPGPKPPVDTVLAERTPLLPDEPYDPVRMGRVAHFEFNAPITGWAWPLKLIRASPTRSRTPRSRTACTAASPRPSRMLQLCRIAAALPDEPGLAGRTFVARTGR